MNNRDKFEQDLTELTSRLVNDMLNEDAKNKLLSLKDWLLQLQKKNVVKINHSAMELVCAKYLIQKGYDVQIEYVLNEILTCDLFSTKGYGNLIVEVETGFIPPDHALDPLTYLSARLASKIIRYSSFAGKFALGIPPHYVLHFPRALSIPPRRRTTRDIEFIKKLCDKYYQNPPVTEEEILNARIQEIYIIDVDRVRVLEMDPEGYMKRVLHKELAFALDGDGEPKRPKAATLFDFEGKTEGTY
ncbi:MAG TPA: hypothetical protein VF893_01975 [Candidatus Bathyarchaeia archaeon]